MTNSKTFSFIHETATTRATTQSQTEHGHTLMQEAALFAKRKEMLRNAAAEGKGCTFKPKLRRKPPRPEMQSPKSLGAQYAA